MDNQKQFARVPLTELRQGRRGKHHVLVTKVIRELKETPSGKALQIPVSALKGISGCYERKRPKD